VIHKYVSGVTIAIVLAACGAVNSYLGVFDLGVDSIVRETRGEGATVSLDKTAPGVFADDLLSLEWKVTNRSMALTVANKTNSTMKLIWDEATFLRSDGSALRLAHRATTSPSDTEFTTLPSVIPRGAKLHDAVYPADNLYRASDDEGNHFWVAMPLLPESEAKTPQLAMKQGNARRGEKVKVLLVVEAEGKIHEYMTTLAVEGVQVWEKDRLGSEPMSRQPRAE
jgi:hypothetical protein